MSIASHATVVGIPVGIAGASLTLVFTMGVVKKLLSVTRKKKKKHDKIISLANTKLNVIETLLSGVLSDFDISHEEFAKIIDEKIKYESMKENVKNLTTEQVNERVNERETRV